MGRIHFWATWGYSQFTLKTFYWISLFQQTNSAPKCLVCLHLESHASALPEFLWNWWVKGLPVCEDTHFHVVFSALCLQWNLGSSLLSFPWICVFKLLLSFISLQVLKLQPSSAKSIPLVCAPASKIFLTHLCLLFH